jgi:hypothetical protein
MNELLIPVVTTGLETLVAPDAALTRRHDPRANMWSDLMKHSRYPDPRVATNSILGGYKK